MPSVSDAGVDAGVHAQSDAGPIPTDGGTTVVHALDASTPPVLASDAGASALRDAGTRHEADGGTGRDAATADAGTPAGNPNTGCGCNLTSSSRTDAAPLLVISSLLGLLVRRRKR